MLPFFEWAYEGPAELLAVPWGEIGDERDRSGGEAKTTTVGRVTGRDSVAYGPQAIGVSHSARKVAYVLDSCNKRVIRFDLERGRGDGGVAAIGLECRGFPVSMAVRPATHGPLWSGGVERAGAGNGGSGGGGNHGGADDSNHGAVAGTGSLSAGDADSSDSDAIAVLTRSGEVLLASGVGENASQVRFRVVPGGEASSDIRLDSRSQDAVVAASESEAIVGAAQRIGCLPDGSILVYDAWIEANEYEQRVARYDADGRMKHAVIRRVAREGLPGEEQGHENDDMGAERSGRDGTHRGTHRNDAAGENVWYLCDFAVGRGDDPPVYFLYYRTDARSGRGVYGNELGQAKPVPEGAFATETQAGPVPMEASRPVGLRRNGRFRAGTPLRLEVFRFPGVSRDDGAAGSPGAEDQGRPVRLGRADFEAPREFRTLGLLGVDADDAVYVGGFDEFRLRWVMAFERGSVFKGLWEVEEGEGAGDGEGNGEPYESEDGMDNGLDDGTRRGGDRSEGSQRPVLMAYPAVVLPDGDVIQMVAVDSGLSIRRYDMRLRLRRSEGHQDRGRRVGGDGS